MSNSTPSMLKSSKFKTDNSITNVLMDEYKIDIHHFPFEKMTFATRYDGSHLLVSSAICAPCDDYSRKIGKARAVEKMIRGECLTLKSPKWAVGSKNFSRELILNIFRSW